MSLLPKISRSLQTTFLDPGPGACIQYVVSDKANGRQSRTMLATPNKRGMKFAQETTICPKDAPSTRVEVTSHHAHEAPADTEYRCLLSTASFQSR